MPAKRDISETLDILSIPEPNTGCWIWMGAVCSDGYGKARRPYHTAHRMAYVAKYGEVPRGKEIHHTCGTRCCVNPDHLTAVTHAENVGLADYKKNHANACKTHCRNGHALTVENVYVERDSQGNFKRRRCRECQKEAKRKRWQRGGEAVQRAKSKNRKNIRLKRALVQHIYGVEVRIV